jgi:hypothetical protein
MEQVFTIFRIPFWEYTKIWFHIGILIPVIFTTLVTSIAYQCRKYSSTGKMFAAGNQGYSRLITWASAKVARRWYAVTQ